MYKTKNKQIKRFLNGVIAGLLMPFFVYAELSKWEDDDGHVHYGDRVPSEYLHKEHSILNEHGVTIRTSEAMKTDAQLSEAEKKRKIEAAEKTKRMIIERKKILKDRVLLDTFTTERDLEIARDARIEAIDSQIALAETLIKNDEKKLADVKERIKALTEAGRTPPDNLHKKVLFVGRHMENNVNYIKDTNNKRDAILKTFEKDIKRFRVLMEQKNKNKAE